MSQRPICKILVLEDDFYVRQLLRDVLVGEGYRFILARDAAEARQALADDPAIDAAVIDCGLPGGDSGVAFAREIAARGCAVVLVTGNHLRFEEVTKSGHRHLFKPFRIATLLELVDSLLLETKRNCERPGRAAPPDSSPAASPSRAQGT